VPLVHHAVHAARPGVIFAEAAPMVPPHRAAVIIPVAPATTLLALQEAGVPRMVMRAQQPGELMKARLLRIIEARIERLAGFGDAL